jgi:hypothetical protein
VPTKEEADPSAALRIAEAAAAAARAIGAGFVDLEATGSFATMTRLHGGDSIACLVVLQLDHAGGDADFHAMARRKGRRALWERHEAPCPNFPQGAKSGIIGLLKASNHFFCSSAS